MTEETRTCKCCGRTLPLDAFAKNRYGYTNVCKECMTAKRKGKEVADNAPEIPTTNEHELTDQDLFAELAKRGWRGELTKTITQTIG